MADIPIARPLFDDEEKRRVAAVLDSGWVTQGPVVAEFEERFAAYVGARHAVATTSCTTALHAALALAGVGPGDEVVVPSLSFIATANAVVHCGAEPVFADVDAATCNLDPERLEEALSPRTRAVVPVHQMGLPADVDAIRALAGERGLAVVEDAACAAGSERRGARVGGGDATACFSFHPRKVITTGEGGMVTTADADLAARLRRFRHHGMDVSDLERHRASGVVVEGYPEVGYNYRMTDLQAAVGIAQLEKLPRIVAERRRLAARYDAALAGARGIRVPTPPAQVLHNYQSYWVEITPESALGRDAVMARLLERGIATRRGIMASHLEPCHRRRRGADRLPVTERLAARALLLPIYPGLADAEQDRVIEALAGLCAGGR